MYIPDHFQSLCSPFLLPSSPPLPHLKTCSLVPTICPSFYSSFLFWVSHVRGTTRCSTDWVPLTSRRITAPKSSDAPPPAPFSGCSPWTLAGWWRPQSAVPGTLPGSLSRCESIRPPNPCSPPPLSRPRQEVLQVQTQPDSQSRGLLSGVL